MPITSYKALILYPDLKYFIEDPMASTFLYKIDFDDGTIIWALL